MKQKEINGIYFSEQLRGMDMSLGIEDRNRNSFATTSGQLLELILKADFLKKQVSEWMQTSENLEAILIRMT